MDLLRTEDDISVSPVPFVCKRGMILIHFSFTWALAENKSPYGALISGIV